MFEHPLNDPTSVRVGGKTLNLLMEGIQDELDMLRRNPLDRFLDDMVAVLVPDGFQDVVLEFLHDASLLVDQDVLKSLV